MTLCSLTASSKRQKLLIVTGRSVRTDNHARMPYPIVRIQQCSADNAHAIVEKRKIDYVLICPNMSESTIYVADAKKGFYVQLIKGKVPPWLTPVALPATSPFRMWRVVRPNSSPS